MGIRTLTDTEEGASVLYCSVSGYAFGPVFNEPETADDFLDWYTVSENAPIDLRQMTDALVEFQVARWRRLRQEDPWAPATLTG